MKRNVAQFHHNSWASCTTLNRAVANQCRQSFVQISLGVVGNRLCLLGFLSSLCFLPLHYHLRIFSNFLHQHTHIHTYRHKWYRVGKMRCGGKSTRVTWSCGETFISLQFSNFLPGIISRGICTGVIAESIIWSLSLSTGQGRTNGAVWGKSVVLLGLMRKKLFSTV